MHPILIEEQLSAGDQSQMAVLDLTRRRRAGAVSQAGGGGARVHSPQDIGKRNAKERAAGACDLGDSVTTTGVFCLCTRPLSDAC
jgi:hypothetical protein